MAPSNLSETISPNVSPDEQVQPPKPNGEEVSPDGKQRIRLADGDLIEIDGDKTYKIFPSGGRTLVEVVDGKAWRIYPVEITSNKPYNRVEPKVIHRIPLTKSQIRHIERTIWVLYSLSKKKIHVVEFGKKNGKHFLYDFNDDFSKKDHDVLALMKDFKYWEKIGILYTPRIAVADRYTLMFVRKYLKAASNFVQKELEQGDKPKLTRRASMPSLSTLRR